MEHMVSERDVSGERLRVREGLNEPTQALSHKEEVAPSHTHPHHVSLSHSPTPSLSLSHSHISHTQAMFRKEEVGDLLSLRYDDTPETTGNDKTSAPQDTYLNPEVDLRHPKGTMQVRWRVSHDPCDKA